MSESRPLLIHSLLNQRGSTRRFEVQAEDVGAICRIEVAHLASKSRSRWLLRGVTINNMATGQWRDTSAVLKCFFSSQRSFSPSS